MKTTANHENNKTYNLFRKRPTEKQIEAMRAKRAALKELSAPLKELKKCGEIETINEGLISIYSQQGHTTLKTLKQWNSEGLSIKKGEKALLLWGKPTASQRKEIAEQTENQQGEETDALDFYPICFVFSNLQVYERTA